METRSIAGDPGGADDDGLLARRSTVGRYLVIERIGTGGMGAVYAAYDPELDRKVAIKILRPRGEDGDQQRRQARLAREAKAIARLSHPNVVGIFDVGIHEGQVFLAMEHLGGGTLRDWAQAGRQPWRAVLKIFIAAGRGLAAAHGEGLVHRDFKLDNVLLDKSGVPKVVDFGVVRFAGAAEPSEDGVLRETADEENPGAGGGSVAASDVAAGPAIAPALDAAAPVALTALTRAGSITGTPAYMAPEQFLGGTIDARTDQFAFCVSLYEALYGERPFAGNTVIQVANAVASGRIREAPRDASVPTWVRKVLLRGLAANPADRHPTVAALLQALSIDPVARRWRRVGAAAAILAVVSGGVTLQRRLEARRSEFERQVSARIAEGSRAFSDAKATKDRLLGLRSKAFTLFDAHDREGGERVWAEARAASTSLDGSLERAQQALEAALSLDAARTDTRRQLAEVVYERATLAELEVRREDLTRQLAALESIDTFGEQVKRWRQPGSLSVRTSPPDVKVTIERFDLGNRGAARIAAAPIGPAQLCPCFMPALAAGSYRLHIEKPGRADTMLPFAIKRGESVSIDVVVPDASQVPPDFAYVPAGRFLFGDDDEELRLSFLNAVPLHERDLHGFLIQRHEVTFSEWLSFLSTLSAREREARLSGSSAIHGAVVLTQAAGTRWHLRLNVSGHPIEASAGEKLRYPGRSRDSAEQDWLKMPVVGVSARDMRVYLAWLSATGRVPGARFCTDAEWERAARGADARVYPGSYGRLAPGDANVDLTYGRKPGAYGPDEVGRHPASRSPFGVDDMAGNAWEVVESGETPESFIARGGCYYGRFQDARSTNREPIEIDMRNHLVGFRVCAPLPNETEKGENP